MTLLQRLENDALTLSQEERASLASDLINSLDPQAFNPSYQDEIKKRLESIENGSAQGRSAEQVFTDLEQKYL